MKKFKLTRYFGYKMTYARNNGVCEYKYEYFLKYIWTDVRHSFIRNSYTASLCHKGWMFNYNSKMSALIHI